MWRIWVTQFGLLFHTSEPFPIDYQVAKLNPPQSVRGEFHFILEPQNAKNRSNAKRGHPLENTGMTICKMLSHTIAENRDEHASDFVARTPIQKQANGNRIFLCPMLILALGIPVLRCLSSRPSLFHKIRTSKRVIPS